jgi:hypothetical protein
MKRQSGNKQQRPVYRTVGPVLLKIDAGDLVQMGNHAVKDADYPGTGECTGHGEGRGSSSCRERLRQKTSTGGRKHYAGGKSEHDVIPFMLPAADEHSGDDTNGGRTSDRKKYYRQNFHSLKKVFPRQRIYLNKS